MGLDEEHSNTCTLGTKFEFVTSSSQEFKTCTTLNSSGGDGKLEADDFRDAMVPEARPGRAARPPSPRVASSERLRVSPNLPDDRTCEPREKEIILVVGFLSDG
ncbi:hypothetical protein ACJJTC_013918 [Scirpophaga incertulas]